MAASNNLQFASVEATTEHFNNFTVDDCISITNLQIKFPIVSHIIPAPFYLDPNLSHSSMSVLINCGDIFHPATFIHLYYCLRSHNMVHALLCQTILFKGLHILKGLQVDHLGFYP